MQVNTTTEIETFTAICSDGYVFIDDSNGEMVNLFAVRSRTPIISEANEVLAEEGWTVTSQWVPARFAAQLITTVSRN